APAYRGARGRGAGGRPGGRFRPAASLPCATCVVHPAASHLLSLTAGEHNSPHASCGELPARRNPSRAVAAETPALTAETIPTRAFSTSSLMLTSRAFSIRPHVHT